MRFFSIYYSYKNIYKKTGPLDVYCVITPPPHTDPNLELSSIAVLNMYASSAVCRYRTFRYKQGYHTL